MSFFSIERRKERTKKNGSVNLKGLCIIKRKKITSFSAKAENEEER